MRTELDAAEAAFRRECQAMQQTQHGAQREGRRLQLLLETLTEMNEAARLSLHREEDGASGGGGGGGGAVSWVGDDDADGEGEDASSFLDDPTVRQVRQCLDSLANILSLDDDSSRTASNKDEQGQAAAFAFAKAFPSIVRFARQLRKRVDELVDHVAYAHGAWRRERQQDQAKWRQQAETRQDQLDEVCTNCRFRIFVVACC